MAGSWKGNYLWDWQNFHFQSLHTEIAPLYLMLDEQVYSYIATLTISFHEIRGCSRKQNAAPLFLSIENLNQKPADMKQFIYLSITPESLIASHLPPVEFGNYLAIGTRKRLRGQAIFLELDATKMKDLPVNYLNEKLIPYKNGEPKRSLYLSIYRVLENTPLEAMKNLYLVTDDGKVLELKSSSFKPDKLDMIHLYQQFNPISTRVASKLSPPEFINFLTNPEKPVYVPTIFMAELKLNKLARYPEAPIHDLPYPNTDHLRDCLSALMLFKNRLTKTVIRQFKGELSYRTIKNGFFLGNQDTYLHFAFPSTEELEGPYYSWWRSALTQSF